MSTVNIDQLLQDLTLEEKVSLLAGASFWWTVPIPRLGIPAIKVTDGPNGARGDGFFGMGNPAAAFPVGIALAATWNPDLIGQIGVALGREAKSKGAHVLLAPTVNIHRTPLNGRNFECYSEDPYLTAEIAVAYIRGLQSQGVGATVKHYVGNDSEIDRMFINNVIDERTLHEIYLPPFKAAVQRAGTWALMTAYNYVNGEHASSHAELLDGLLRETWGYDGIVMSDWTATRSTAQSVNAGQDLEMPGPTMWRGGHLVAAVRDGKVTEATLNARARAMLTLIERVGAFDAPDERPEQANDFPEDRALIRRAGAEGAVLLKNADAILPLTDINTIAIIGPNAKTARTMGGGSANLKAHYEITPFEGIFAREEVEIAYAQGGFNHQKLPRLSTGWFEGSALVAEFFDNEELSGAVVATVPVHSFFQTWMPNSVPAGVNPFLFSVRITGTFTPPVSGDYTFSVACGGLARLGIDGVQVVDNWTTSAPGHFMLEFGAGEAFGTMALTAGQQYTLTVEFATQSDQLFKGIAVGCLLNQDEDAMIAEAAAIAATADVALVFVGLNAEWESEGADRLDMELPRRQNDLVRAVAAANPRTVVVLQSGSPVTMPWLDSVAAVLQMWYPGQECGNAIADVLFGDVAPSGRLPQTFPQRLADHPAFDHYPGVDGQMVYHEGVFIGYRHYQQHGIAPLFPFGFGLTYTTFGYANLRLSADGIAAGEGLTVTVDVTNTGARAGHEVVQLYLSLSESPVPQPPSALKAFAKVEIPAGETRTVTLALTPDAFAHYDVALHDWQIAPGRVGVLVGASSADIRLRGEVVVRG